MDLISLNFLIFSAITLAMYYLLPFRFQNAWLLAASLFFYLTRGVGFTALLLAVILVNFFLGRLIVSAKQRKAVLISGLVFDISALVFFRFTSSGTIIRAVEYLTRQPAPGSLSILNALLPIGFSFYILQAISYLVDVYRKQIPPSDNIIDYALYMAYFPRLLSGPIERARAFLPQLSRPRRVDNPALARAFTLLMIGLLRKVVIAEVLKAAIPEYLFTRPLEYASTDLVFGIVIYGFWLYNDFAGYTGIVRGVSGFFGIELSPNFQQPFFARSFVEFWNRWHMSLSFWLRDYIYFPLSRKVFRRFSDKFLLIKAFVPSFLTMLASGFWHSLGAYMLAWGALHGFYQTIERLVSFRYPAVLPEKRPAPIQAVNALTVNLLLIPTWILFGSGSLQRALRFSTALFTADGVQTIFPRQMVVPVAFILISLLIDWFQFHSREEYIFCRWSSLPRAAGLALIILALFFNHLWSEIPVAGFIYQGF